MVLNSKHCVTGVNLAKKGVTKFKRPCTKVPDKTTKHLCDQKLAKHHWDTLLAWDLWHWTTGKVPNNRDDENGNTLYNFLCYNRLPVFVEDSVCMEWWHGNRESHLRRVKGHARANSGILPVKLDQFSHQATQSSISSSWMKIGATLLLACVAASSFPP